MNYTNKNITLSDGTTYMVIEQVTYDNKEYLYVSNIDNDNDTSYVVVDGDTFSSIDAKLFQEKILPLFLEKFRNY